VLIQSSREYGQFVERRRNLNEQIETTGLAVDDWIATHEARAPSLGELAELEGLLSQRRDLLSQLASLDDAFMDHLVSLRARQQSDTTIPQ